uniref:SPARC-related modular calcium-binding protein 1-like n=1 Tax=Sinocyclocheilus rhinocerous TaxID=307959 RepID=A0A673HWR1_9TELE
QPDTMFLFFLRVFTQSSLSHSARCKETDPLLFSNSSCWCWKSSAVCGSNGRMYKSLCSFQRAQCINRRLRTSKCQLARSQALRASAHSDSSAVFIPECKADGTYTEVQCHNQTGYCWCSSPDGIPMSGSSVLHLRPNCTGESCLRAQSTNSLKTCKHERMSVLTEAAIRGSEERFVPECSADGRYRAVQCHSSTGYCWCVRVDSGRPVPRTSASVRKAEFLKSLIQCMMLFLSLRTPAARPHVLSSPASFSSVQTLRLYFTLQDTDADGLLSEREARPLRLLLRRTLRPRRCAKKFMQFCDQNADRHLSAQELTSCLVQTPHLSNKGLVIGSVKITTVKPFWPLERSSVCDCVFEWLRQRVWTRYSTMVN